MKTTIKSNRGKEWLAFSDLVANHIEKYTVPQWGDSPDDQLATEWTIADCLTAIKKYTNRSGKNSRGQEEDLRDPLKMAHYACVLYFKMIAAASPANEVKTALGCLDHGDIVNIPE